MNSVVGLAGSQRPKAEREFMLKRSLSRNCGQISVVHPSKFVSLAWSCEDRLVSYREKDHMFVLLFGAAYKVGGPACTDLDDWTREILNASKVSDHGIIHPGGSYLLIIGLQEGGITVTGDPAGNRQPYYMDRKGEIAFATHPLACARILGKPHLDRTLEDFLLIYGFLPDGRTLFDGVTQLQTGRKIILGDQRSTQAGEQKNGSSDKRRPKASSRDYVLNGLYEVLLNCIRDQLPRDDNVGVLLGGFDSALVAALLKRLGKNVHTYSFRYQDTQYNQPHVDSMAHSLGFRHKWVDITPDIIAAGLDNYAEEYVQPTNWPNYVIQTTHVCRVMRDDGITVAFSGDGCDALFLGYPGTYLRTRLFSRLPKLPGIIESLLIAVLGNAVLDRSIGHPYRVAMGILRAMSRDMPVRAFLTFRAMDMVTLSALRNGDNPPQAEDADSIVQRLAWEHVDKPIQRLGYISKSLVSPNKAKLLAAMDVTGVNIQSPYNHPDLRKFTTTIPEAMLREEAQDSLADMGKLCLMQMAERFELLPAEVIYQPKLAAIDSPMDDWLENELAPALERALTGLPFEPNRRQIEAMKQRTWAERFYKRYIGSTRVISDAISLLATYGAICGAIARQ